MDSPTRLVKIWIKDPSMCCEVRSCGSSYEKWKYGSPMIKCKNMIYNFQILESDGDLYLEGTW